MNYKMIAIPFVTASMLCAVYLLPDAGDMSPAAINMDLPLSLNGWTLQKNPPTPDEILLLAKDTTFSKAICFKARQGEYDLITGYAVPDRLNLSIVLSGHNLNDSIHRPERCMPAQGHSIKVSTTQTIELSENRVIPTRRLISTQSIATDESQTNFKTLNCVTYYFFVGHRTITSGHYERTIIDMKDRLLLGMDQRWAYVSVSMWYGKLPWIQDEISIDEADEKLSDFVKNLVENQIHWEMLEK